MLRNAAMVLGNHPAEEATGALEQGLDDPSSLIRAACAWALGRYDAAEVKEMLRRRHAVEENAMVRKEIETALEGKEGDD